MNKLGIVHPHHLLIIWIIMEVTIINKNKLLKYYNLITKDIIYLIIKLGNLNKIYKTTMMA